MLKMTKIELKLISNIDICYFIGNGMGGDANNKYMTDYGSFEESKFTTYLDTNKLYIWAMSQ